MMQTILVALENRDLALAAKAALEARHFQVRLAFEGFSALAAIRQEQPDVIIVSLLLPGLTGLDIWRHVSADPSSRAPAVVMVAGRVSDPENAVGVSLGPGDEPAARFEFAELVPAVESRLARASHPSAFEIVRAGTVVVDLRRRRVSVDAQPVRLTGREFGLLRALLDARGRVVSRERLLQDVWGAGELRPARARAVDVYIRRLRMKLGPGGHQIITVRNVGYRFALAVEWISFGGQSPRGPEDPRSANGTDS